MADIDFIIERLIMRVGNQCVNIRNDNLKKREITSVQSETLLYFEAHEGAPIWNLKKHLNISHQAARNLVERIRLKDYLYLETSKEDARFKCVYLTEKGKYICSELKKEGTSAGQQLLKGLSAEEKEKLLEMLERMSKNV
ncbi:MAG: hypothetical protein LUH14_11335 [Clostridiaceae bacterium]|nr:hypothetical protein [Clostridiaceae bacterium]